MDTQKQYFSRAEAAQAQYDIGLRSHMLKVYNYMASGLALTGIVAYAVAHLAVASWAPLALTDFGMTLYTTPLKWVVMLAPLAFVFALSLGINRMSYATASMVFWVYAAAMGLSLSSILLVFTGESVARVFFISAATFAATSLYGYTTKRDLSRFGSFMFMGLIGIVLASVVNIFLGSSALQFAISVIGVLVFTGLTAWDTQRIKEIYTELDGSEIAGKKALMGALSLYLNFINLFMMMMHLFGSQRE
ncbi:MAG: Bax inhibitor-1/YccA family protein [Alphaproteobacteria bacterium]|nr:Bax inhibitor-1/YccA family protein [Alphaproteobacteria bacterium]MBU0797221.1 Bax inhibitor-1/YccA family protein [Alphaproteobacteria bacterium]MBU0888991.1 Bax inhibitor-1/YccA family protein [Alphaproteobacteria bacterium]MBU1814011.1 Bax inhibitor-1/YccA family protein [Alphaproteobacteria bacterium]